MADRKPFLLRIDAEVLDAVQRWANDDLRSLNGQIEFLLRKVLKQEGRLGAGASDASKREEEDAARRRRVMITLPRIVPVLVGAALMAAMLAVWAIWMVLQDPLYVARILQRL